MVVTGVQSCAGSYVSGWGGNLSGENGLARLFWFLKSLQPTHTLGDSYLCVSSPFHDPPGERGTVWQGENDLSKPSVENKGLLWWPLNSFLQCPQHVLFLPVKTATLPFPPGAGFRSPVYHFLAV